MVSGLGFRGFVVGGGGRWCAAAGLGWPLALWQVPAPPRGPREELLVRPIPVGIGGRAAGFVRVAVLHGGLQAVGDAGPLVSPGGLLGEVHDEVSLGAFEPASELHEALA